MTHEFGEGLFVDIDNFYFMMTIATTMVDHESPHSSHREISLFQFIKEGVGKTGASMLKKVRRTIIWTKTFFFEFAKPKV